MQVFAQIRKLEGHGLMETVFYRKRHRFCTILLAMPLTISPWYATGTSGAQRQWQTKTESKHVICIKSISHRGRQSKTCVKHLETNLADQNLRVAFKHFGLV